MRTEMCACGGCITAPSLARSAPYVEAHNATLLHRTWRVLVGLALRERYVDPDILAELVPSGPPTYRDPRRPTAGRTRDLSGSKPGASADEGAG